MKTLAIALVAAVFAFASPAQAQKIDLSTITCKAFLGLQPDTVFQIMLWMSGYYADQDAPAVIDLDKLKSDMQKLYEYCAKNPTIGLITAAEETISNQ